MESCQRRESGHLRFRFNSLYDAPRTKDSYAQGAEAAKFGPFPDSGLLCSVRRQVALSLSTLAPIVSVDAGGRAMKYNRDDSQIALNEIVEQIVNLQPNARLPMSLNDWLKWLEEQADHPMMMTSVRDLDYPWQPFMRQQNQPLLWSASWYARRREETIIRKVRVSKNFNNDKDYITFTDEYAVTHDTKTSGSGDQVVYIYGFKNDPDFLKVGLAGNAADVSGAFQRVRQQISTSNRMLPTLHHVIFTNNCAALEKALHRRLKNEGRWVYDGAGTEWFRVSVDEVLEAYGEVKAME